tara:strand:- start:4527 stop:7604 length:3078 start_codon:yes stop_codon:yes gene_type:complete
MIKIKTFENVKKYNTNIMKKTFLTFDLKNRDKTPAFNSGWEIKLNESGQRVKDKFGNNEREYERMYEATNINDIKFHHCNMGIVCGEKNDIWVLDIDVVKDGSDFKDHPFFKEFGFERCKNINTFSVKTGNKGLHYYFKYDSRISKNTTNAMLATDVRSNGGYVVSPYSYLDKSRIYEVFNDCEINECPVDILEWTINQVYPNNKKAKIGESKFIEKVKETKDKKGNIKKEIIKVEIKGTTDLTNYVFDIPETELNKIINGLPNIYRINYSHWLIFTTSMKLLNDISNYDVKSIWDDYSKGGENYDYNKNMKNWDGIKDYKHLMTLPLLMNESTYSRFKNYYTYVCYKPILNNIRIPDKIVNKQKLGYDYFLNEFDSFQKNKTQKIFIQKSDTGTGKTTSFRSLISTLTDTINKEDWDTGEKYVEYKKKYQFLSIVSRISLAQEQHRVFNDSNVKCSLYLNMTRNSFKYGKDSLVIQIDSIMKIIYGITKGLFKNYILYLDEFNSLIEHLITSPTLDNKRLNVYDILIDLIKQVKFVIGSDADISQTSLLFLEQNDFEYKFVNNEYQHNKNVDAYEITDRIIFIEQLKKEDKFLCCCDSKTQAELIFNKLIDYYNCRGITHNMILLTSDNLELPNFDGYDKIIYSPKIIYGIDSSMERPVYCYYAGRTISPTAMVQQISRCRNIVNLYYYFDSNSIVNSYKFETLKDTKEWLIEKEDTLIKMGWNKNYDDSIVNGYINLLSRFIFNDDCYSTNKMAHFRKIIFERGFINKTNMKLNTKSNTKKEKIINEIKLNLNFDPESLVNKKTNEILNLPTNELIIEHKLLFRKTWELEKHFNICDYFFMSEHSNNELEGQLIELNDWNMNKIHHRKSRLMFINKLRETIMNKENLKDKKIICCDKDITENDSKELNNYLNKMYDDNVNPTKDSSKQFNKDNVGDFIENYYKDLFGKQILKSKRIKVPIRDDNGNELREPDYQKEFINKKGIKTMKTYKGNKIVKLKTIHLINDDYIEKHKKIQYYREPQED